jgi:DNA-binding LytR/AlgR family response regulator
MKNEPVITYKPLDMPTKNNSLLFKAQNLAEIVYLESDLNYTRIYFLNGQKHLVCRCLKYIIAHYLDQSFVRIHRSYCVNKQHIKAFDHPNDPERVYMSSGHELSISRRRKLAAKSSF